MLWWFGTPVALGLLNWGPNWIRNGLLGRTPWYSIPLATGTVFDVTAYLQPMSQSLYGSSNATLIGPMTIPIRFIALLIPQAGVVDIMFAARWLSMIAVLWTGAWCISRWSGLDRASSRLFSLSFLVSLVLVLGMKPGAYSWFMPLGMLSLTLVFVVHEMLERQRFMRAIALSAIAFTISSVYAWYFLFVVVWLGVAWFQRFARSSIRLASMFYALGAAVASGIAITFAFWIARTAEGTMWIELHERLSLGYTHMIFVSGSALLTMLWAVLFVTVTLTAPNETWRRRAMVNESAWLTLLLAFFQSPFTGHFILNDHFRIVAVILSYFSLATVWAMASSQPFDDDSARHAFPKIARAVPIITLAVSAFFVLKIIAAPYAWNNDFVNIIQITHWFALLLASWLVAYRVQRRRTVHEKHFFIVLLAGSLFIGGNAYAVMVTRDIESLPRLERLLPVINWIRSNVPRDATLCADYPGDGYNLNDVVAAHTGRVTYFAHTSWYQRERDIDFLNRMRTVIGFYDIRGAGVEEPWRMLSTMNQFVACDEFPYHVRLFRALGLSQDRIDDLIECPRKTLNARWAYVEDAIERPNRDIEAFKRMCPFVVVPETKKTFWHLPDGYRETRVTNDVSVWSFIR